MIVDGVEDFYLKDIGLWSRLSDYNFENIGGLTFFCRKLAEVNAWSFQYAEEVVKGYKKFVYLCCISSSRLSPSDAVDQAWHQHMLYSQEYWGEFCSNILKHDLHHVPSMGAIDEVEEHQASYQRTLDLYLKEFKQMPSQRLWPSYEFMFSDQVQMSRINLLDYWYFPRSRKLTSRLIILGVALIFFFSCLFGFWPFVLLGFFLFFGLFVAATSDLKTGVSDGHFVEKSNNSGSGAGSGCGGCGGGGCGD